MEKIWLIKIVYLCISFNYFKINSNIWMCILSYDEKLRGYLFYTFLHFKSYLKVIKYYTVINNGIFQI